MPLKREFYSTNEVAQMLGISPFTIRRYIRLRKLKAVKLEGSYRVRQSELDKFLKERELETEEELAALDEEEEEEEEEAAGIKSPPPAKKAPPPKVERIRAPADKKKGAARPKRQGTK